MKWFVLDCNLSVTDFLWYTCRANLPLLAWSRSSSSLALVCSIRLGLKANNEEKVSYRTKEHIGQPYYASYFSAQGVCFTYEDLRPPLILPTWEILSCSSALSLLDRSRSSSSLLLVCSIRLRLWFRPIFSVSVSTFSPSTLISSSLMADRSLLRVSLSSRILFLSDSSYEQIKQTRCSFLCGFL